jgi:tape measure domain-containing protein
MAVKVKVVGDKADFDRKMDAVENRLQALGKGALRNLSNSFANFGKGFLAAGAIVGGIKAIGAAISSVVQTSGKFERMETSFTAFIGDAERAKRVLAQIREYEAETPLGLEELMGAGRQLLGFGMTAEGVLPVLKQLGELSAGTNIPLSEMADLFGRNRVQGVLFTKDIREFLGRGIPIDEYIAKDLGVARSMVSELASEGKITADMMERAIRAMTSEGGKFYGQTAAAAATLEGKISTLESAFTSLKDAMGDTMLSDSKSMVDLLTVSFSNLEKSIRGTKDAAGGGSEKGFISQLADISKHIPGINGAGGISSQLEMFSELNELAKKSPGGWKDLLPGPQSIFVDQGSDNQADKDAYKAASDKAKSDADELAKRREGYEAELANIAKQAARDRLTTEQQVAELRKDQEFFVSAGAFDEAIKVYEKIAKLDQSRWDEENKKIDEAAKKKLSYEQQIFDIAEAGVLKRLSKEQQIAYLRQQEAQALAGQDYDRAKDLLGKRASLEGTREAAMGVADSLRRVGGGGGYYAPARVQEKALTVAEKSQKVLEDIRAGIDDLSINTSDVQTFR